ncbi:SigB/SigF/SigG family RNA polymerase sigma factor [Thermasporomyces composti]|jgi:RNA polymerase sigma-B factor|uniref:RNA polymerase sigma-B factor n=1 Tax=Thermasporomyces composti TaxID=696763 RepID=A0A3D9V1Z7_THECX|nr:SigB/SigF/SigG family RNA polymerase sigma factor [Thermasporomyces composti]REF35812.1 RNA polymerase sigma-B factor [Thermasporomyces composti]
MTAPIAVDDIETIDGAGRVPSPEVVDVDVPGLEPGLGGEDGPEGEVSGQERARRLIVEHIGLARQLARRYAGRGEPLEELVQVAMVGLVQAAARFDPERGSPFSSFAVPTILGELRRHFRDHCWSVRVPRRLHDVHLAMNRASEVLSARLKRAPTIRELADALDVTEEEILESQEIGRAYSALSLDCPVGEEDSATLGELVGDDDDTYEYIENREAVRRILPHVPPRERRILYLRFYKGRTQSQIAEEFGISQMQVSRLLSKTLRNIRSAILSDEAAPMTWPKPRTRPRAGRAHLEEAS